jgi:hypothetical protein
MKETLTWEPLSRYFPDGVLPSQCPTRIVLDHVTSRWGVLILVSLAEEGSAGANYSAGWTGQRENVGTDLADTPGGWFRQSRGAAHHVPTG